MQYHPSMPPLGCHKCLWVFRNTFWRTSEISFYLVQIVCGQVDMIKIIGLKVFQIRVWYELGSMGQPDDRLGGYHLSHTCTFSKITKKLIGNGKSNILWFKSENCKSHQIKPDHFIDRTQIVKNHKYLFGSFVFSFTSFFVIFSFSKILIGFCFAPFKKCERSHWSISPTLIQRGQDLESQKRPNYSSKIQ